MGGGKVEAHVRLRKSDDGLRSQECCLSPFRNNFLLASHSTNYVIQLNSKSRNSPLVPDPKEKELCTVAYIGNLNTGEAGTRGEFLDLLFSCIT